MLTDAVSPTLQSDGQKQPPAAPQLSKAERKKLQKVEARQSPAHARLPPAAREVASSPLLLIPLTTCTPLRARLDASLPSKPSLALDQSAPCPPPPAHLQEAKVARELRASLLAELAANSLTSQQQALLQSSSRLGQRETLR